MYRRRGMRHLALLVTVVALPGLGACGRPAAATETNTDLIQRGAYLAAYGGCGDCHTPKRPGRDGPVPDSARLLSGYPGGVTAPSLPSGFLNDAGWAMASTADLTAWAGPWGVAFAAN